MFGLDAKVSEATFPRRRLRVAALAAALAVAAGSPALGQDANAALLANACTSCHGVNGHSQTAIPAIAGQPAAALVAALTAFRAGERTGTIMGRIAKGYSDAQIAAIADYFSKR